MRFARVLAVCWFIARLSMAPGASAQCTATLPPNLPAPGVLKPNFGNFVNVVVSTSSGCSDASITYAPQPPSGIIVDQSNLTTNKQGDGTYPDVTFTFRATGSAVPGRYTFPVRAIGSTLNTAYNLTLAVAGGFSFDLNPATNPINVPAGTSQKFTISTTADSGFSTPINYQIDNSASYPIDKPSQTINSPYPNIDFTISVPSSAVVGSSSNINITATAGSTTITHTVVVMVTAPPLQPDFTVSVAPPSISVTAGGAIVPILFSASGVNGFSGSISVTAPVIPGVTFSETQFTMTAGQTHALNVTAQPTAAAGLVTANFTAQSGTIGPKTVPLAITINAATPAGDFNVSLAPASLTVKSGSSATSVLTLSRLNGFAGTVDLSATSSSPDVQVQFAPSSTLGAAETTRNVIVSASNISAPSVALLTITATAPSLGNKQQSVALSVTLQPGVQSGAPVLTAIAPDGVVAGAAAATVLLSGQNFASSVKVIASDPRITVQSSMTLVPGTLASAIVRAKPGTPVGRYSLSIQNDPPSGATSQTLDFFVYDAGSIGAPLGVTGAAILSPLSGKCMYGDSAVYAHGIVATSGTGTIMGHWELEDGGAFTPFSTFTLTVQAGEPAPVDAKVPVPRTSAGIHRLRLVIDQPALVRSAEVELLMSAVPCASDLTILGPLPDEDAAAAGAPLSTSASSDRSDGTSPITMRWSLVPSAIGYVIEIEKDGRFFKRVGACSDEEAREGIPCEAYDTHRGEVDLDLISLAMRDTPGDNDVMTAEQLAALRASTFRWRVTSRYSGEFEDIKWSPWAPLPIPLSAAVRRAHEPVKTASLAAADLSGVSDADGAAAPSTVVAKKNPFRHDWLIVPSVTSTYTEHAKDQQGIVQISSQADFGQAPVALKYTTDLNGTNLYGDHFTAKSSRNWVANFGNAAKSTLAIRPEAIVGYAPPAFFAESQYVNASFARGGAVAKAGTRFGTLSYYSTFDSLLTGIIPGEFSTRQKVEAAAFELPKTKRLTLKLLGLRVEDLATQQSVGSTGRSLGFFMRFKATPRFEILAEAARGKVDSVDDPAQNRNGSAYRVGFTGSRASFTYRLNLNHTDSGFVNPANRGFTYGGVPDRTGGDLAITKTIAGGMLSAQVRRQQQSRPTSHATATGLNVAYNHRVGSHATFAVSGNRNDDQGTRDAKRFLPATDRQQTGLTMSLSESFGRFSFSQSLAHQQLRDQVHATAKNDTNSLSITGSGALFKNFNLSANLSAMSSEGVRRTVGKTDTYNFGLQPAYSIPTLHLSLAPRFTFSRVRNDLRDSDNESEQYSGLVDWQPVWLRSIASLQLASNWNRNRSESAFAPRTHQMTRSYTGTFALRWGAGIGPALFHLR